MVPGVVRVDDPLVVATMVAMEMQVMVPIAKLEVSAVDAVRAVVFVVAARGHHAEITVMDVTTIRAGKGTFNDPEAFSFNAGMVHLATCGASTFKLAGVRMM